MRAIIVSDNKEEIVKLVEQEEPKNLKNGEVLVQTTLCSLCHSDLHMAQNPLNIGVSIGHESIGKVLKVGEGVNKLKVGDLVGFPAGLHGACGSCYYCKNNDEVFCEQAEYTTERGYGTMQDLSIEREDYCIKLPDNIDLGAACIATCAGITVYKGFKSSKIKEGSIVAIFGIGGLGNVAVEYAKNFYKAKVIAIGSNKDSLEIAKNKGADYVINWKEENFKEKLYSISPRGVDVSLVTSSTSEQFKMAYETLSPTGQLIAIGLPPENLEINIPDLVIGGKQIIGSLIGNRNDLKECFDHLVKKIFNPEYEIVNIEEAPKYFKLMKDNKLFKRIVFNFNK
ncbi:zinc-binding dehydrogenase [Spiroplasma turonicum]|uniref:Alcohol dehydrogenase n=1 Tax=Spiroplasma turonicum TaxID=216946 RepID=A0A0K1P6S7_9MOLU|nr:zinc-binding dehydrogenase [Spiroplasma turonicum]AKU79998.1 alcohol dehydrogenase, propanol-preferring [Spiroplasma turonicum]ALX71000.1 alcohol dehydrogenase, propanol-preferring [Spiroplasma turonicum]